MNGGTGLPASSLTVLDTHFPLILSIIQKHKFMVQSEHIPLIIHNFCVFMSFIEKVLLSPVRFRGVGGFYVQRAICRMWALCCRLVTEDEALRGP